MIRAGVDDPEMARVAGIRVSRLFTIVFCLGAWLAGFAGVIGGPILSVYPGLDQEMLPAGPRGGHPRGQRQSPRLPGRQLHRRLPLQFRPGDVPRAGLRRAVPARCSSSWWCGPRACSDGRRGETPRAGRRARDPGGAAALGRAGLLHQYREPDPPLRDLRARYQHPGGLRGPRQPGARRAPRHRGLRRGPHPDRRAWPPRGHRGRAGPRAGRPPRCSRCSRCAAPASGS